MKLDSTLFLTVVLVALLAGPAVERTEAAQETIPFAETAIRIEVNATDGDAGLQLFLDGDEWEDVTIFYPDGKKLVDLRVKGTAGELGLTEVYIESEEPSFDELPLAEFLELFPEGIYSFQGRTVEGDILFGSATLTHTLPDAPVILTPAVDDVDPENTVVSWVPVADPAGSAIVGYRVIVEREEPVLQVFSVDLPPTTVSVTVPPEFMEGGVEYKAEIIAMEASGNQTISEREFETAEE